MGMKGREEENKTTTQQQKNTLDGVGEKKPTGKQD